MSVVNAARHASRQSVVLPAYPAPPNEASAALSKIATQERRKAWSDGRTSAACHPSSPEKLATSSARLGRGAAGGGCDGTAAGGGGVIGPGTGRIVLQAVRTIIAVKTTSRS